MFVGYAGAGVGALDVSNSDAVAGQDPTNPVTFAFGSSYAFARTIVSMDAHGTFSYTPTIDYGGNNGRSALLGSNGLYYAVGNANNGNASTFGASNGTSPDVTETTGLEVVTPIDAALVERRDPARTTRREVDPLIQYQFADAQARQARQRQQLPRRDRVRRRALLHQGQRQQRHRHGLHGELVADGGERGVRRRSASCPGFPTDSAKATGGNFTPFAVFFANATTMYVTDEGTGNALDQSSHAGLEKWSLVDGTWQLDYVLTNGLIGTVDTGPDRHRRPVARRDDDRPAQPDRASSTGNNVTLCATTSTSSASGDNGADPNKVVVITDSARGHDDDGRGGERILQRRRRADLRHRLSRRRAGQLSPGPTIRKARLPAGG